MHLSLCTVYYCVFISLLPSRKINLAIGDRGNSSHHLVSFTWLENICLFWETNEYVTGKSIAKVYENWVKWVTTLISKGWLLSQRTLFHCLQITWEPQILTFLFFYSCDIGQQVSLIVTMETWHHVTLTQEDKRASKRTQATVCVFLCVWSQFIHCLSSAQAVLLSSLFLWRLCNVTFMK